MIGTIFYFFCFGQLFFQNEFSESDVVFSLLIYSSIHSTIVALMSSSKEELQLNIALGSIFWWFLIIGYLEGYFIGSNPFSYFFTVSFGIIILPILIYFFKKPVCRILLKIMSL